MSQFDVFENLITRARRAYPFVVVLQAEVADTGRDRIVAPARAPGPGELRGQLTPYRAEIVAALDYLFLGV